MLEAVPNVSEGRDPHVVGAIGDAFATRAILLDVHSDPDHHRSVFTLAATTRSSSTSLLAGLAAAVELIDLREHVGVHPRVGVADVVPLVPLVPEDMRAQRLGRARRSPSGSATELGLPVFHYGEIGGGRRPAFFRRGGLEELRPARRVGRARAGRRARAASIRARVRCSSGRDRPLVAYNVELATDDVERRARDRGAPFASRAAACPACRRSGCSYPARAACR